MMPQKTELKRLVLKKLALFSNPSYSPSYKWCVGAIGGVCAGIHLLVFKKWRYNAETDQLLLFTL